jgi:O-antigen ligase
MAVTGRLTFVHQTAYMRRAIWDAGTEVVRAHPITGIGMKEWPRPDWMPPSVDNFWLLTAMRYGLPALAALAAAAGLLVLQLSRKKMSDSVASLRTGWTISFMCICFAGTTVHMWSTAVTFFFFLMGSSAWMLNTVPQKHRRRLRRVMTVNDDNDDDEEGAISQPTLSDVATVADLRIDSDLGIDDTAGMGRK